MSKIVADMSMSLDGFVAEPNGAVDRVFAWYANLSEASGARMQEAMANVGALVCGRRTFDQAEGWGGRHPMGVPVFVVTHQPPDGWDDAPFTFVTDGVPSAVEQARAVAGDKWVGVASPDITRQCLEGGLLDLLELSVVPVLLGDGVRFFSNLATAPIELEGPRVIEGDGVTHLSYAVRR